MYLSAAALDRAEHCRTSRLLPAARRLLRLPRQIGTAEALLARAVLRLRVTLELIDLEPDRAGGAREGLTRATSRWMQASAILLVLSERAGHTVVQLRETLDTAAEDAFDDEADELSDDGDRPPVPQPYLNELLRRFLRRRHSRARERLRPLRRRRSAPLRTTDAPRRVSRGRAPPFFSTCPL